MSAESVGASDAGPAAIVRPRPGIVAERVGEELLLLDADTAACSELNRTGALLWECLPASVAGLMQALTARFPGSRPRVEADVRAWLGTMLDEGWVVIER